MKRAILIHTPHTSLRIPNSFKNRIFLSNKELDNENLFLSDIYIDKLLYSKDYYYIKYKYSRIFCDVERYKNDKEELMSKYGMGVIYNRTSDNKDLLLLDKKYKKGILLNYYDNYHKKLDRKVMKIIKKYNKCLIIDLHSFSDEFVYNVLGLKDCPDICIGINSNDKKLIEITNEYFSSKNLSMRINYPYSGSIIPNTIFNKSYSNFLSVMIEINKRIYLNNKKINYNKFDELNTIINEYINILEEYNTNH